MINDSADSVNHLPKWNIVEHSDQINCGSCHGLPPAVDNHPIWPTINECYICHFETVDNLGNIMFDSIGDTTHIDGVYNPTESFAARCDSCHSNDLSFGAPNTKMNSETHLKHTSSGYFAGPMPCSSCHLDPGDDIFAEGHLDTGFPAELFPGRVFFSGIGSADKTSASFDSTTNSCTSYCHGGGRALLKDETETIIRNPVWGESNTISCGSCHGLPPKDGSVVHQDRAISDCTNCHIKSIGANLEFETVSDEDPTTYHINGQVDLR